MLVDNAIVMAESIMVQMSEGRSPTDAAIGSARELRFPLLISSLTTSAAFLPIFLAESSTGEYTAPLFKVVTITLLSSWLLALTMTPLLCVLFLKVAPVQREESFGSPTYRFYRRGLTLALRHRVIALGSIVALFVLALQGFGYLPNIFFPPSDKAIFTVEYDLPAGTTIERTEAVVAEIDQFIERELTGDGATSSIVNWVTFVGNGGPRFYLAHSPEPNSPNYAFSIVNATSRDAITEVLIPRLEAFCREAFPDLDATLNPLQLGPPVTSPVQVRLSDGTRTSSSTSSTRSRPSWPVSREHATSPTTGASGARSSSST